MGEILKKRLKMSKFESPFQEGMLALLVTASELRAQMDRVMADSGLTSEQYNILRILRGVYPDGHPCGEVADRMIDRAPDITRRIDALEKQGYVERERSSSDRRVVMARITQRGLQVIEEVTPKWHEFEKTLTVNLKENDLKELARICESMIEQNPGSKVYCGERSAQAVDGEQP